MDPADGRAGPGPRVAIKDLIDVAGHAHHRGLRGARRQAVPAERDAACMARLRAADVAIVGKANLHELACGGTGVNPHFGTPGEPVRPRLHPRAAAPAATRSRWPTARSTSPSAATPPARSATRRPAAARPASRPRGAASRSRACGRWRRRSTRSARWPATSPASSPGWRCSSPASPPPTAPSPVIGRVRLPDVDPGHRRRRRRGAGRQRARGRRGRAPRLGRGGRRRLGGDVPRVLGGRPPPLRAGRRRARRRHRGAHGAGP